MISRSRSRRIPALVAAGVASATDLLYLWITFHQGGPVTVPLTAAVAGAIGGAALLVFVGALMTQPGTARGLMISGGCLLLGLGVLGLFSIGIPLFVAGVLSLVSASGPAPAVAA